MKNGGNPFALDIQLPKYKDLPFYKEWLPINALFMVRETLNEERFHPNIFNYSQAMNEFLGPLGWRPTSTEKEELSASAPTTRNSIFASAPKTQKSSPSNVASSVVSTSRWLPLPYPNPWSKNTVNPYQMKFHHNLQQFRNQDVHSSHYNKWGNYLKPQSIWG